MTGSRGGPTVRRTACWHAEWLPSAPGVCVEGVFDLVADRPVPRAWHAWSRPERYLAAFGGRTRAEIDVMRRRGAIRGRNAVIWVRIPGTATGTPRSSARRPASTTGPGAASLAETALCDG